MSDPLCAAAAAARGRPTPRAWSRRAGRGQVL